MKAKQVTVYPADAGEREVAKDYRFSKLYMLMKPLLTIMKLGGVFYENSEISSQVKSNFGKYYCIAIFIFDILNTLRLTSCFWVGSPDYDFAVKVVMYAMLLQLPCYDFVFLRMSRKGTVLTFIEDWDGLQNYKKEYSPVFDYRGALRRGRNILLAFAIIEGVCVIGGAVGVVFFPVMLDFYSPFLAPLSKDFAGANVLLSIWTLLNIFSIVKQVSVVTLLGLLAYTIYRELYIFLKHFKDAISTSGEFTGNFEMFRLWHTKICDLVLTLDDILGGPIFILYATVIPGMCVVIYALMNGTLMAFTVINLILFMSVALAFMIFCLAVGIIWINHPAHLPLEYAYRIDMSRVSQEVANQINVFIGRMNGPSIGLTAMDLFTLDKPMVLTMTPLPTDKGCNLLLNDTLVEMFRNGTLLVCKQLNV
ncbi:uncharacterized protein LOC135488809 isoform X2 [Lineus longissimus]|uniref:uncharacterized protein LOC135488809 isoform X2 n=1 Tax=Lineus longissimus TaxID=88925 RepID=UPI00315D83A4